jgi:ubiquinone/menaquinone biosynthesis C-methylase UbiE
MLIDYLKSKDRTKTILECGCGNGWLTNKLSEIEISEVIGLDINVNELEQAARVFGVKSNILFIYGDIFKMNLKCDYMILSGAIAYFNDLKKLLASLLNKLNPGGEIHIIDSPLYKDNSDAKARTAKHFKALDVPEMINYYHHHSFNDLKEFQYDVLYNPFSLRTTQTFYEPGIAVLLIRVSPPQPP